MAANLAVYWGIRQVWQIILFYFVTPGVIVAINLVGVGTFGWIEAIGGILKILLVLGTTIVLYVMAAESKSSLHLSTWVSFGVLNLRNRGLLGWRWT
jgi:amino acid transporter